MIFDLLDQIYDSALDPDLWPAVLAQITTMFGAVSTTMVPLGHPAGVVISPGGEDAQRAYVQHWWKHDSIFRAITRTKPFGVFCDWALLSPSERAHDPFYHEFRRPFEMKHNIAFGMELEPFDAVGISLQLPLSAEGPPDDAAVTRFAAIGRHVGRALRLGRRFASVDMRNDPVAALMDTLSCGVVLLDGPGNVLLANAAMSLFDLDGLRVSTRGLVTARPADQAALDELIGRILKGDTVGGAHLLSISRPSGRRPFLLGALAVMGSRRGSFRSGVSRQCHAIVTVVDPEAPPPPGTEAKLRALTLSPAEARLTCAIGQGLSPREAADRLGLTEGTVRTRLKVIYDKLSVSRQSELARLVTQLTLVTGPGRPA